MTIAADQPDRIEAREGLDDANGPEPAPAPRVRAPRGTINMDRAARYVEIVERLKILGDEENALKEEKTRIEEEILEEFERTGLSNFKVSVGEAQRTVYLHRSVVASPTDNEAVVEWFRAHGLREKVRVLPQSLTALVREYDERGEELPSDLVGRVKVTELFSVRSRKA